VIITPHTLANSIYVVDEYFSHLVVLSRHVKVFYMNNGTPKMRKQRPIKELRFPALSLQQALEKARALYRIAANHEVPLSTASKEWGYSDKSSGGITTVAALRSFGLVEDVAGGGTRKIKLAPIALQVIRDPREISPDRDALVKQIALHPPLHSKVATKYNGLPPSEEALRAYLQLDLGMAERSAAEFVREYTATLTFAKVSGIATIQELDESAIQNEEDNAVENLASPSESQIASASRLHRAAGEDTGATSLATKGLNEFKVDTTGGTIRITAHVDSKGWKRLKKVIEAALSEEEEESNLETTH
jgi:hypothetical protein